jgi:hypothetical protein
MDASTSFQLIINERTSSLTVRFARTDMEEGSTISHVAQVSVEQVVTLLQPNAGRKRIYAFNVETCSAFSVLLTRGRGGTLVPLSRPNLLAGLERPCDSTKSLWSNLMDARTHRSRSRTRNPQRSIPLTFGLS